MQAILVKTLPATHTKPTRYKVSCSRGSKIYSADGYPKESLVTMLTLGFAQEDLARTGEPIASNPWRKPMVEGLLPNGDTVFVFTS